MIYSTKNGNDVMTLYFISRAGSLYFFPQSLEL